LPKPEGAVEHRQDQHNHAHPDEESADHTHAGVVRAVSSSSSPSIGDIQVTCKAYLYSSVGRFSLDLHSSEQDRSSGSAPAIALYCQNFCATEGYGAPRGHSTHGAATRRSDPAAAECPDLAQARIDADYSRYAPRKWSAQAACVNTTGRMAILSTGLNEMERPSMQTQ
jgi:hypothetical protein